MKRTTAPHSVGGQFVDRNTGTGTIGTISTAEDRNNVQEEICNVIEGLGLTLDGAVQTQLRRAVIGLSKPVGELFMMETDDDPGVFFPAVRRNADVDISSSTYPLLVAKLRASKAKIDGQTDFVGTVSGSTITFSGTTPVIKMLTLIQNEALVAGFLNQNQNANFTADFTTSTTQKCVNIAGVDYPIVSINLPGFSVTVSGTPTAGTQTANFYPYRIAGNANAARLPRLTGFVPVASGDYDGRNVCGYRAMDRWQGVKIYIPIENQLAATNHQNNAAVAGSSSGTNSFGSVIGVINPDGANGTPRTGKTTEPKSAPQNFYTWAGVYNA